MTWASTSSPSERSQDLDRIVFFSDAVFAIAMTLLALSLQLPAHTSDAHVGHALEDAVPSIYTYLLSFAVISLYWLAHHRMFRRIVRVDPTLLALNLATLAVVAFTPFPTTVFGDHGATTVAAVFYAATMAVLGAFVSALWWYASHGRRLIAPDTPSAFVAHSLARALVVPAVFLVSIPVAFISASAAEWCWIAIVPVRLLLRRHYGSITESG
jgi:uncharacterized membrane protein